MKNYGKANKFLIRASVTWFILLVLSVTTLFIGKTQFSGMIMTLVILAMTFIKGQLIVDHFMELLHTRLLWRLIMTIYLLVVIGAIAIAYSLSI